MSFLRCLSPYFPTFVVHQTVPRLTLETLEFPEVYLINELSCWIFPLTLVLETRMMSRYITWKSSKSLTFLCFSLGCCCIYDTIQSRSELFLAAWMVRPDSDVLKRYFMD